MNVIASSVQQGGHNNQSNVGHFPGVNVFSKNKDNKDNKSQISDAKRKFIFIILILFY
jgi:hypothetical protein